MSSSPQAIFKHRLYVVSRAVSRVSFLALVVIATSSIVRSISLAPITNENGVPSSWQNTSLSEPETITLPITYWDQKADACDNPDRQFEWTECERYRTHGVLMGMVKPYLGADGLPVPAFANSDDSWNALHDALSVNVTGHNPVLPTDNFYRWFHEVPGLSKRINGRTITFHRTSKGTYIYGGQDIYPIDDVPGLDESDIKLNDVNGNPHNFNFTAHLKFAVKIEADGSERFEFSGDDDVWVYLNNRLLLDIGGLHGQISGWFQINADGTVNFTVENVNNLDIRDAEWAACMRIRDGVYANPDCVTNYNTIIRDNFKTVTVNNIDFGLKPEDVVNLDFFYAERSSDGSNTKITINHMNWPISADSAVEAQIISQPDDTANHLIEFDTYVKNRDPDYPLKLERLAAYVKETTDDSTNEGFLPLDQNNLTYSTTPSDETSWQPVDVSAPSNSLSGFTLATPIRIAPYGQTGDTLYFRYYGETSSRSGAMSSTVSYYTTLGDNAGITYDRDKVTYTNPTPDPEPTPTPDPEPTTDPDPDPEPNPDPNPDPANPIPGPDLISPSTPDTGLLSHHASSFGTDLVSAIPTQPFIVIVLLTLIASLIVYFSLNKFASSNLAARIIKKVPPRRSKSPAKTKQSKPASKPRKARITKASKTAKSSRKRKSPRKSRK